jgi:four helix bundle protein
VAANIAEGQERDGNRELMQFLSQAKGSCGEVRSHLWIALDQHYLDAQAHHDLTGRCLEISRMLAGLIDYLKRCALRGTKYR